MKRTNLDNWIETTEEILHLTRENLEQLQLCRLNETLKRLKDRGGFYKDYPEKLDSLADLQNLPFTRAEDFSAHPGKFLLTSQSEVSRVISGATSGTTGPAKRVFYTEKDTEQTIGLFTAVREQGMRIPDDIDLIGFDCVNVCTMMKPPLPVVFQPEEEIGRIAANYLIERLAGYSGEPRIVRLNCQLVQE